MTGDTDEAETEYWRTLGEMMALRRVSNEHYRLPPKEILDLDMLTMSVSQLCDKHGLNEEVFRRTLELITRHELGDDTWRAERVLSRG